MKIKTISKSLGKEEPLGLLYKYGLGNDAGIKRSEMEGQPEREGRRRRRRRKITLKSD